MLADSAFQAIEQLLKLLGWEIADAPEKRLPFSKEFVSLGVKVCFDLSQGGFVQLKNKDGRVDGIVKQFNKLKVPGATVSFKDALSLRGKISFAEGQTHARLAAPAARLLAIWARDSIPRPLSKELAMSLAEQTSWTCTQ